MRRLALAGFVIVNGIAGPLDAQRLDARQTIARPDAEARRLEAATAVYVRSGTHASTRSMVIGGILEGALGMFGGAIVGMALENCDRRARPDCGMNGGVLGGILGEAIGPPEWVIWVTNGRGKLARTEAVKTKSRLLRP